MNEFWADSGGPGAYCLLHPFAAYSNPKNVQVITMVANYFMVAPMFVQLIDNTIAVRNITTGIASGTMIIREGGYLP